MQRREWIAGVLSAAGMTAFGCENRRGSSTGVSPRLPAGSKYSYMFSSVFQKNDSDVTEPRNSSGKSPARLEGWRTVVVNKANGIDYGPVLGAGAFMVTA